MTLVRASVNFKTGKIKSTLLQKGKVDENMHLWSVRVDQTMRLSYFKLNPFTIIITTILSLPSLYGTLSPH